MSKFIEVTVNNHKMLKMNRSTIYKKGNSK